MHLKSNKGVSSSEESMLKQEQGKELVLELPIGMGNRISMFEKTSDFGFLI